MKDGFHVKHGRSSVKAVMLVSCLLLCTMTPLATALCDEDSHVYADSDGTFTYVSLGDTMVNGYGMTGYYDSDYSNSSYGFLVEVPNTYPTRLKAYLGTEMPSVSVEHLPMAISSMRSVDLRAILDPTFQGDGQTEAFLNLDTGNIGTAVTRLPAGYTQDVDGLRQFYIDSLTKADLVSYQFQYDFGFILYDLVQSVMDPEHTPLAIDMSIYIGDVMNERVYSLVNDIVDLIMAEAEASGMDPTELSGLVDYAMAAGEALTYAVIGCMYNFSANMELILGMNPDAKILVVDSYNTFVDMDVKIGDYTIPLGGLYDLVLDVMNMYTKYMSEYSGKVYHVSLDEYPTLFVDEFMGTNVTNSSLSNDAKNVVMSALQSQGYVDKEGYSMYNMVDTYTIDPNWSLWEWATNLGNLSTNHGNFTKFLNCIFNSTEIDATILLDPSFDMDAMMNDLFSKIYKAIIDVNNFNLDFNDLTNLNISGIGYIMRPNAAVTSDAATGACTVSCNAGSVTFSALELSLIRTYLYVMQVNGVMTHPCAQGHGEVFDAIKAEIISENVLTATTVDQPSVYDMLKDGFAPTYTDDPSNPASDGTLLNLGDSVSGYGSPTAYPKLTPDALGLELNDIEVKDYLRVEDINYLIGGTGSHDEYTDAIIPRYCAEMGMSQEDIEYMYVDAIGKADVILINMSMANLMFPLEQVLAHQDGGEYSLDLSDIGFLDEEMRADIMKVHGHLDAVVTKMFGNNAQIMELYDTAMVGVESGLYSLMGYVDDYFSMLGRIYELNSDVTVICISPYNPIDGFWFEDMIEMGNMADYMIDIFNYFLDRNLAECRNVEFVDILDVHINVDDTVITGNMTDIEVEDAMSKLPLTPAEHAVVSQRIVDAYNESGDTPSGGSGNTLLIGAGVAVAAIAVIGIVLYMRRS